MIKNKEKVFFPIKANPRESWIPDSLSVELGFRVPVILSGIPDSLSCMSDSKAQDYAFHKQKFPDSEFHTQKFPGFQNTDSLTWGEMLHSEKQHNCWKAPLTLASVPVRLVTWDPDRDLDIVSIGDLDGLRSRSWFLTLATLLTMTFAVTETST